MAQEEDPGGRWSSLLVPHQQSQLHCVCVSRGGRRDRTLYADSPPLPPPPPWKLAGKCRTMGAEGALRKFCLT